MVCVAAKNEAATIRACVSSLLIAAENKADIVIVEDGSTDETPAILKSFGNQIRVVQGKGKGPGAARNLVLFETQKHWIAFTDADTVVSPSWLRDLVQTFERNPIAVGVGGPQCVRREAGTFEKQVGKYFELIGFVSNYIQKGEEREVKHNPTCNVMYQVSGLKNIGGFNESLWPCEDLELDLNLKSRGMRLMFQPKAWVEHERPQDERGLMRMAQRYGYGHARLVQLRGVCAPIQVIPFLTLMLILGWALGSDGVQYASLWGALGLWVYFCLKTKQIREASRFWMWTVKILAFWNWGFLKGLVEGSPLANHD